MTRRHLLFLFSSWTGPTGALPSNDVTGWRWRQQSRRVVVVVVVPVVAGVDVGPGQDRFCVENCSSWNRTYKVSKLSITQGKLKGKVSLYHWPPVWLVWNRLYANWQFLFLFVKQTNPNQSNRRSMVQYTSPFSIPCLISLGAFPWANVIKLFTAVSYKFFVLS
jgi:hypothetical protein